MKTELNGMNKQEKWAFHLNYLACIPITQLVNLDLADWSQPMARNAKCNDLLQLSDPDASNPENT